MERHKGMNIKFTVYGEPVAKGRSRFFRRGNFVQTYTPKETERGEYDLKLQALKHKPEEPLGGPVVMVIRIFKQTLKSFSRKRADLAEHGLFRPDTKPDWDNYGKLVSDALNGIFYRDDSQVVDCRVMKYYSKTPRIEIEIGSALEQLPLIQP